MSLYCADAVYLALLLRLGLPTLISLERMKGKANVEFKSYRDDEQSQDN